MAIVTSGATRVDLAYIEGDDPSFVFSVTLDGTARDLTGVVLTVSLKADPSVAEADATVFSDTDTEVDVTDASGGLFALNLTAAQAAAVRWYIVRVTEAGRTKAHGYGALTPTNV